MRFHALATDRDEFLTGTATNDRQDPARAFCDAYRKASRRLFRPSTLSLEPAFWGGADAATPDDEPLRIAFTVEDEPGIFAAVFACLGHDPQDTDVVVMMREEMLAHPIDDPLALRALIAQDAGSVLVDAAGDVPALGRLRADIMCTAIAAVILRSATAAEAGNAAELDAIYRELCAGALAGVAGDGGAERRSGAVLLDSAALFVRTNPGVVTLIDRVVTRARTAPPLALPLDADAVVDAALRVVADSLATVGDYLQVAD